MALTLADVGEFGLIARLQQIVEREGKCPEALGLGIGDDTALFTPRPGHEVLVTCDSVVEGRHYLPDRITPHQLGQRAMDLNISDIGAMGGIPRYALVSLGLHAETPVDFIEAMYRGFLTALDPFDAAVIGGNLTKTSGPIFIDITLIGEIEQGKALHRCTARPGDRLLVTGAPGQSAAGLALLLKDDRHELPPDHPLVEAYLTPGHRAREGRAVALTGRASAMIDTSDGLLGDLGHLCQDSGVGACLKEDQFPLSPALREGAKQLGRSPLEFFLGDSDDYELLITCAPEEVPAIRAAIAQVSDVPVTEIGEITARRGEIALIQTDGQVRILTASGWDHFRQETG